MRTLARAPLALLDPRTGDPAFGSYEGSLPRVELFSGGPLLERALRRKKWVWLGIASEDLWVTVAVVRMGYATNAFGFVYDLAGQRMLADRAVIGPPRAARVADASQDPMLAGFRSGKTEIAFERAGEVLHVRARLGGIDLEAALDGAAAPPAISAIARLGPGLASTTEKRALLGVRGHVVVDGDRRSLDGAAGGYDYTHGLMPRHTRWRWAFGLGKTKDGDAIGLNLVEGFVGEAECVAFHRNARGASLHPLAEPRFTIGGVEPGSRWTLAGEGVDLSFDLGAAHVQRTNLGVVRSRFIQAPGVFRGKLRIAGRDVEIDAMPAVVEDQDVLW